MSHIPPKNLRFRPAEARDDSAIFDLISRAAKNGLVLPRTVEEIDAALPQFMVVTDEDNTVLGCVALRDYGEGLVEVRSLVVCPSRRGHGIGTVLVDKAVQTARERGMTTVFTLTYRPHIFERLGFSVVDKHRFPQKVWADCRRCAKRDHCDEIALIFEV
jgi:amino-acid N-acetyltransferase